MRPYEKRPADACGTCRHFRLHYGRYPDGSFFPLHYGHCTFPRCKPREEKQTCPHWEQKADLS